MQHQVKILTIEPVTHDVIRIVTLKPAEYAFRSGQATDVAINKENWKEQLRPFTFTSLPEDDHLEFTIKTYPAHKGVTNELLHLRAGDELILHDVFGDIGYKGEGVFIAGGAGVTPFIAIVRHLQKTGQIGNNKLICANKRQSDIIHEKEFREMLGENFINILSEQKTDEYAYGYISNDFLKQHIKTGCPVYLCGPPPMMDAAEKILVELEVPSELLVKEGF